MNPYQIPTSQNTDMGFLSIIDHILLCFITAVEPIAIAIPFPTAIAHPFPIEVQH